MYKNKEELVTEVEREGEETRARSEVLLEAADNGAQVRCEVSSPATRKPLTAATTIHVPFPASELRAWIRPMRVEAGEEVAIVCQSSSSRPASAIIWHSRGVRLQGATTTHSPGQFGGTITRSELLLRTLASDDGRMFTCDARNGLGVTVTNNVTLDLVYGPVWLEEPASVVDVEEGEDLIITVAAEANPPPVRYTWWRGPLPVEGGNVEDSGRGQLRITAVHRQDAGTYSVTATSPHGSLNASFVINVLYGPESVVAPERVTVDEGDVATVSCSAVGNPTPNITWTRDPFNNTWRNEERWGVGEANLVVEKASRTDTALYYCLASNSVSSATLVATALVVTQAPTPPPAYLEEASVGGWWAAEGDETRMDCRVLAAPPPTFRWTINDDRVLLNSRKYFVRLPKLVDDLLEWSSVLEIRKVVARDYTEYSCTAVNSRGSLTTNYTLSPPIPPPPPTHLQVARVRDNTVSLAWSSNDTEAHGYIVRYQEAGSSDYELVDVRGSNASSVNIDGLTSGAEYFFAIQSYNEQGHSHYTSPAIVVTMFNMEDGMANSNSSNLDQPPVPRLLLLLLSLTGAALLVLNIAIIACFVRRRAIKRSTSGSSDKTTAVDVFTPQSTPASAGYDDLSRRLPVNNTVLSDNEEAVCLKVAVNAEETVLVGHRDTTGKATQYISSSTGSHKVVQLPPKAHITPHLGRQKVTEDTRQLQPTSPVAQHHFKRETPQIQVTPPYSGHQVNTDLSQSHTTLPVAHGSPGPHSNIPSSEIETGTLKEETVILYDDLLSDETTCKSFSDNPTQGKNRIYKRVSGFSSNIPDVCLKSSKPHERETLQEYAASDQVSLSSQLSTDSQVNLNQHPKRSSPCPALPHCNTKPGIELHDQLQPETSHQLCLSLKPVAQVIYHGQPHIQQQFEDQQHHQQLKELKIHQQYSMQQSDNHHHQPLHQLGHCQMQQHQCSRWHLHCNQNEHSQDLHHHPHVQSHQMAHDHSCERQEWHPLQQQHHHHHHHHQQQQSYEEQQPLKQQSHQQRQQYHQQQHSTRDDQHSQHRHQLPLQQHQKLQKLDEHQQLYSTENDEHRHYIHHNEGHQRQLQQSQRKPEDVYHKDLECCKPESHPCYQRPQRHPHYIQEPSLYEQSSRQTSLYETSTCELLQYEPSTCDLPHCESSRCEEPQCNASHLSKYYAFPSDCCDERCRQTSLGEVT